jgi:hypothetical protein
MAFDRKKLQTLKWLRKIATTVPSGMKTPYNSYRDDIFVRFGRFYATNGYMVACASWDENFHDGYDEWLTVKRFEDEKGHLLETLEFAPYERYDLKNDAFERFFPVPSNKRKPDYFYMPSPALVTLAMRGFALNDLYPTYQMTDTQVLYTAHNRDIELRVSCMLAIEK